MREAFNHPCPLVVDQRLAGAPLAEDRKIDFYSDGHMVFRPVLSDGACESACALVKVDEESDPYERLIATIRECEGADIIMPANPIKRILVKLGFKEPKYECPAALQYFDYSSRRQIGEHFGQGSDCR